MSLGTQLQKYPGSFTAKRGTPKGSFAVGLHLLMQLMAQKFLVLGAGTECRNQAMGTCTLRWHETTQTTRLKVSPSWLCFKIYCLCERQNYRETGKRRNRPLSSSSSHPQMVATLRAWPGGSQRTRSAATCPT